MLQNERGRILMPKKTERQCYIILLHVFFGKRKKGRQRDHVKGDDRNRDKEALRKRGISLDDKRSEQK